MVQWLPKSILLKYILQAAKRGHCWVFKLQNCICEGMWNKTWKIVQCTFSSCVDFPPKLQYVYLVFDLNPSLRSVIARQSALKSINHFKNMCHIEQTMSASQERPASQKWGFQSSLSETSSQNVTSKQLGTLPTYMKQQGVFSYYRILLSVSILTTLLTGKNYPTHFTRERLKTGKQL